MTGILGVPGTALAAISFLVASASLVSFAESYRDLFLGRTPMGWQRSGW